MAGTKKKVKRKDGMMTKKDENDMVSVAEREIEKFVKEWKKNPYLWESETDVHAELYMRIKSSLHKRFPLKKFKYNGMVEKEYFDRVYCKPKTYIDGEKHCYYPDIVIYKDAGQMHKVRDRENDPMLWVCEIKYITNWSSLLSEESVENDIKKLKCLLVRRKRGADYVCYLILRRSVPISGSIEKVLRGMDKKIRLHHYSMQK